MNQHNGWSNWESQLNRKTERHRKAGVRHWRRRIKAAALIELILFLAVITLISLDATGRMASCWALPLAALAICAMSFCGGYIIGGRNA